MSRQQHAVAKHIAAHVANADDRKRLRLRVLAKAAEVALDTLPSAACGDRHFFVVVAGRAARGECIAKPKAILGGDAIGRVGEACCAFVGGNDQVGVVRIVPDHIRWRHHGALDQVVGDIEQTAQVGLIAGNAFFHQCVAIATGCALQDEAAFGTDGNDDRIFDLLRLDQPEHFGSVVFHPIGPTQATACDLAAAQVHPFDARRMDKNFEHGFGFRQTRYTSRIELKRQHRFGLTVLIMLEKITAQGSLNQRQKLAQDAVFVKVRNAFECSGNGCYAACLCRCAIALQRWVKASLEQRHQFGADRRIRR